MCPKVLKIKITKSSGIKTGNNKNVVYLNFNLKTIIKPIINIAKKKKEDASLTKVAKKTKKILPQRLTSEISFSP